NVCVSCYGAAKGRHYCHLSPDGCGTISYYQNTGINSIAHSILPFTPHFPTYPPPTPVAPTVSHRSHLGDSTGVTWNDSSRTRAHSRRVPFGTHAEFEERECIAICSSQRAREAVSEERGGKQALAPAPATDHHNGGLIPG